MRDTACAAGGLANRSASVNTVEQPVQARSADRYNVPSARRTVTCSNASQPQTRHRNVMTVYSYSSRAKEKRGDHLRGAPRQESGCRGRGEQPDTL
jgi:hypothetical protein